MVTLDITVGLAIVTFLFAVVIGQTRSSKHIPGLEHIIKPLKTLLISILSTGPVPNHVAFVMDGNRRYAKKRKQETREGHNAGFETMSGILEFSYRLGIKTVSVYAFSIENFKRPKHEVDSLMDMAKSGLLQICDNGEIAQQYGVKVQVLGDLSLLPSDVRDVAFKVMELTKNNHKATLNVCCPYTSRDDITSAIKSMVKQAETGSLDPESITENLLEQNMSTRNSPTVDLLIRTSDVDRFSDFMLWETKANTQVEFVDKLWPDFSCWDYFTLLLKWGYRNNTSGGTTVVASK